MDENPAEILTTLANLAALLLMVGGITVWVIIFRRWLRRRPLVAFEPRRPVPWNGWDVVAIIGTYFLLFFALATTAESLLGWEFGSAPPAASAADPKSDASELDRAHPVVVLLSSDLSRGTVVLCLLAVVIMAPLAEEFVFRLLLQGLLENVDCGCRRVMRYSSRLLGLGPVVLSSFVFASLHFRTPGPQVPEEILRMFMIDSAARVILVVGGVGYLRGFRAATWGDLGIRFDTFFTDLRLAVTAFVAVIVPIYLVQEGLDRLFPDKVPDPVPLFFFALALGYLYFRTHRLMPAILLHLIFNATGMAIFFAMMSSH